MRGTSREDMFLPAALDLMTVGRVNQLNTGRGMPICITTTMVSKILAIGSNLYNFHFKMPLFILVGNQQLHRIFGSLAILVKKEPDVTWTQY
jgi:hypothetical protein